MLQVAAMQRDSIELQQNAKTEDQTVERSFIHVLDVCEAVHASLYWMQQHRGVCESFDIAGESSSILKLIKTIEKVTETQIKTLAAGYEYQEIDQVVSNSDKAVKILNWQSKRSIEQMIQDEWRFYKNTL